MPFLIVISLIWRLKNSCGKLKVTKEGERQVCTEL